MTMKEIAKIAGVSAATVSKLLNNKPNNISKSTRERVLRIVKEYNYEPNSIAKGLKIKKTNTLGFILPDIRNPFFPEIAKGIQDEAAKHKYGVILCNTDNDEDKEEAAMNMLRTRMIDGIIFTHSLCSVGMEKYKDGRIPMVCVDRIYDEPEGIGIIHVNEKKEFYRATACLINHGCRRIAFIGASPISTNDRLEGYESALFDNGIKMEQGLKYLAGYDVETGDLGIKKILSECGNVDGVVCGNDLIAIGVLNGLHEAGLSVPSDIKVIGFDDIYISKYLNPRLTTVSQPAYQFGVQAVKMLIKHINTGNPLCSIELECSLIMRETV